MKSSFFFFNGICDLVGVKLSDKGRLLRAAHLVFINLSMYWNFLVALHFPPHTLQKYRAKHPMPIFLSSRYTR